MRLAVYDSETTGVDPESARIVSAYLGFMDDDGQIVDASMWLIDPGVEIPEEAAAVHGITTEHAREHGAKPCDALAQIEGALYLAFAQQIPLVIYNARYDLTVLDREIGRTFRTIPAYGDPRPVFDPLVVDKAIDRYRSGPRTLAATAAHYGIRKDDGVDEADLHSAAYDALLAGRLALALLRHDRIAGRTFEHLHDRSVVLAQDQAIRLRDHHRSIGKSVELGYREEWPVIPR